MICQRMEDYVSKRLNQPTVILCFRILLENHKKNGIHSKMSKTEIGNEFNKVHDTYGIATYRRDYVLRQAHDVDAIAQDADDLFFIKPSFLEGMTSEDYDTILRQIDDYWGGFSVIQEKLINEIQSALESYELNVKIDLITSMLTTREAVKRGQAFEVASFSVLNTFLYSLGFTLNRFSTTYSNDGGIDYVAQNAICQVTTKLSETKFDEDIKKVTGKARVLIFKDKVKGFQEENLHHPLVLNYIDKNELLDILQYLTRKFGTRYVNMILQTMITEFKREFYQNTGEADIEE